MSILIITDKAYDSGMTFEQILSETGSTYSAIYSNLIRGSYNRRLGCFFDEAIEGIRYPKVPVDLKIKMRIASPLEVAYGGKS